MINRDYNDDWWWLMGYSWWCSLYPVLTQTWQRTIHTKYWDDFAIQNSLHVYVGCPKIATVDEDLKMTVEKWPVVQAFGYDERLDLDKTQIHVCLWVDGRVLKGLQVKPYNDCVSTPIEIRTGLGQVGSSGIRGKRTKQPAVGHH